jgi:regulator of cell morphogenesis and NO signaling
MPSTTTQTLRDTVWLSRPVTELTDHLVEAFHDPLRAELPGMQQLVVRLDSEAGDHRRALEVIAREFSAFTTEVLECIEREERELFVLIARAASNPRAADGGLFESLRKAFEAAHESQTQTLRLIGRISDEYRAPANAGSSVRRFYRGASELERFMQLHVHLEDHVLLPRASELFIPAIERS